MVHNRSYDCQLKAALFAHETVGTEANNTTLMFLNYKLGLVGCSAEILATSLLPLATAEVLYVYVKTKTFCLLEGNRNL